MEYQNDVIYERLNTFETGSNAPYLKIDKRTLAEAGFIQEKNQLKCVGCSSVIAISRLNTLASDPRSNEYHSSEDCCYAKSIAPLEPRAYSQLFKLEDSKVENTVCTKNLAETHQPKSLRPQDLPRPIQSASNLVLQWILSLASSTCKIIHSGDGNTSEQKSRELVVGTGCVVFSPPSFYSSIGDDRLVNGISIAWSSRLDNLKSLRQNFLFEIMTIDHICAAGNQGTYTICFEDFPGDAKIQVLDVKKFDYEGVNKSLLLCTATNPEFIQWLKQVKTDADHLTEHLPISVKKYFTKSVLVISHPHGNSKVATFGESQTKTYVIEDEDTDGGVRRHIIEGNGRTRQNTDVTSKVLLYTAETCEGSSGAPVVTFREQKDTNDGTKYQLAVWTHCGVEISLDLNCSNMEFSHRGQLDSGKGTFLSSQVPQAPSSGQCQKENYSSSSTGSGRQQSNDASQPSANGNQKSGNENCVAANGNQSTEKKIDSQTNQKEKRDIVDGNQPSSTGNRPSRHESHPDGKQNQSAGGANQPPDGSGPSESMMTRQNDCPPIHPYYIDFRNRLSSFDGWTHHLKHTPTEYAHGGFFWTGSSDWIRCFYCGLGLMNMKPEDDVFQSHESHRPNCGYHQIQISPERIRQRQSGPNRLEKAITRRNSSPQGDSSEPESSKVESVALTLLRKENELLDLQSKCKMCNQKTATELFLPCGHVYVCAECNDIVRECPKCEQKILATVTIYWT